MTGKEEAFFKKRIEELCETCRNRGIPTHSLFLNAEEQAVLQTMHLQTGDVQQVLSGGFEGAERRIVCFLPPYLKNIPDSVFSFLALSPSSPKFAETLSHRDFLGALMHLSIRREMIGDILVPEQTAYVIALSKVSAYIRENLHMVRHTPVIAEEVSSEQLCPGVNTEEYDVNTASLRIDAILGAVYRISRSRAKELVMTGRVFVNSSLQSGADRTLKEGDILSVRGRGRFRLLPGVRTTRNGRLFVRIELYS